MCTLVLHSRRRARQAFFRFDGRSCEGAFTHYRYSHRQPTPVAPIHALRPPCRRRALGRGGRAAALLPGKRPGGSTVATKICSRRNLLELDVQHDEVELAVEQLGVVVVARLLEDHIELRELAHLAECGCEQTGTQARAPARAESEPLIACTGQAAAARPLLLAPRAERAWPRQMSGSFCLRPSGSRTRLGASSF